jgi:lysozyme
VSAVDIAVQRLETEEGFRASAYKDIFGNTTIGYGFNVDAGISRSAAAALLVAQVSEAAQTLASYPWYTGLDDVRASVMLDIAVNAGIDGLLKFPRMIAAAQAQDWPTMASECAVANPELDASRYAPLRQIILSGAI